MQNIVQTSIMQKTLAKIWKRISTDTDMALRVWHSIEAGHMDPVDNNDDRLPKCENKFSLVSRDVMLEIAEYCGLPQLDKLRLVTKKMEVAKVVTFYLNVGLNCAVPSRSISVLKERAKTRCEEQGRTTLKLKYVEVGPKGEGRSFKADFKDSLYKLVLSQTNNARYVGVLFVPTKKTYMCEEGLVVGLDTEIQNPWHTHHALLKNKFLSYPVIEILPEAERPEPPLVDREIPAGGRTKQGRPTGSTGSGSGKKPRADESDDEELSDEDDDDDNEGELAVPGVPVPAPPAGWGGTTTS